jgi:hypothetical protein
MNGATVITDNLGGWLPQHPTIPTDSATPVHFQAMSFLLSSSGNWELTHGLPNPMWFLEAYVTRSGNFFALLEYTLGVTSL